MRTAYHVTAAGPFKPYVRMTQAGKWVKPEAKAYLASKQSLGLQFTAAMVDRTMIPRGVPLAVEICITHNGGFHHCDLDNQAKAILDAAQGIVFEDDRWVDSLKAKRERGDCDLVQLYVRTME